jgi:hypothetical protein
VCWKFASNVRSDQWSDGEDGGDRQNCYQVCVHIEPGIDNGGDEEDEDEDNEDNGGAIGGGGDRKADHNVLQA